MKRLVQILIAIAFGLVLLELTVLMRLRNWFEFSWMRISGLASAAALLYIFIFERKRKSK